MADARSPNVLWAERKDRLYITVEVQDCTDAKVDIGEDGKLSFSGHGGADKALYAFELQLLKAVSSKESKVATTPRSVFLMLMKEASGPHWGKLLKAAGKPPHFVKVDWSKYKDEEDEDSELAGADTGFDMSQFADLSNFGGGSMGADDDGEDSDDDDLPDLEDRPAPAAN